MCRRTSGSTRVVGWPTPSVQIWVSRSTSCSQCLPVSRRSISSQSMPSSGIWWPPSPDATATRAFTRSGCSRVKSVAIEPPRDRPTTEAFSTSQVIEQAADIVAVGVRPIFAGGLAKAALVVTDDRESIPPGRHLFVPHAQVGHAGVHQQHRRPVAVDLVVEPGAGDIQVAQARSSSNRSVAVKASAAVFLFASTSSDGSARTKSGGSRKSCGGSEPSYRSASADHFARQPASVSAGRSRCACANQTSDHERGTTR